MADILSLRNNTETRKDTKHPFTPPHGEKSGEIILYCVARLVYHADIVNQIVLVS